MQTGNGEATAPRLKLPDRSKRGYNHSLPAVSRRDFLKLGGVFLGSLVTRSPLYRIPPPDEALVYPIAKARVATHAIYRYREPSFQSERLGLISRDELVNIYEEIISPAGPSHNPRWYLLSDCYAHSGFLQRVDGAYLNRVQVRSIPQSGRLGEITVPYTQSYRWTRSHGWAPLYRLYYQSLHWVTGLENGPDGTSWYQLTDDLLHVRYNVPTRHVRLIAPRELSSISPWIPPEEKRIEVSIEQQKLFAFHGNQMVFSAVVSTGRPSKGASPNGIPTETPLGRFRVVSKMPSRHMGDGELTDDIEAYELIGVPWVSYFHQTGVAFHGTYWHDNFGRTMSHGCVNMRVEDAKWLYRWTTPVAAPNNWYRRGLGTLVVVS